MLASVTATELTARRSLEVLVVEDVPDVRERLVSLVADISGLAAIAEAGSLREARALLQEFRPDVVLLDLRLPDGSGLEVLREIRNSDSEIFVAVLTAFDSLQIRRSCLAAGASAFLSKTSGLMDLSALLSTVAEHRVR